MRKFRFTETQIVAILKDQNAGVPDDRARPAHGIHPNTLTSRLNSCGQVQQQLHYSGLSTWW
jgi:hypothetical protein